MDTDDSLNQIVNALVKSTDPTEVKQLYRIWADSYESDLERFGYVAPQLTTELLSNLVDNRQALIYDAGCGTGLVGRLLNKQGYQNIHGADFSTDMLTKAESTGIYAELSMADYSNHIRVADSIYDVVISVGVYTARFEGYFIPEMLRILRPGGTFLFTCREKYYADDVKPALQQLVTDEQLTNLQVKKMPYMHGQQAEAYYISMNRSLPINPLPVD